MRFKGKKLHGVDLARFVLGYLGCAGLLVIASINVMYIDPIIGLIWALGATLMHPNVMCKLYDLTSWRPNKYLKIFCMVFSMPAVMIYMLSTHCYIDSGVSLLLWVGVLFSIVSVCTIILVWMPDGEEFLTD